MKHHTVYESWPAATSPQPVAKPLVKRKEGDSGEKEVEEENEGEATAEGNKRVLADILSVSEKKRENC